jgi:hypothetical protein
MIAAMSYPYSPYSFFTSNPSYTLISTTGSLPGAYGYDLHQCGPFLVSGGYYNVSAQNPLSNTSTGGFLMITVIDPNDTILNYVPRTRVLYWNDPVYNMDTQLLSCSITQGLIFVGGVICSYLSINIL